MNGRKELLTAISAGYPYFYCQTYEIQKTVDNIVASIGNYVSPKTGKNPFSIMVWDFAEAPDPEIVLSALKDEKKDDKGLIIIAKNFNWFLTDDYGKPEKSIVSFLQAKAEAFTSTSSAEGRKCLIIVGVAPFSEAVPKDLEKDFMSLSFGLPEEDEIKETYSAIKEAAALNPNFQSPDEKTEQDVLMSCKGMTVRGIKNALSFSLVQEKGRFNPKTIAEIRAQGIEALAGVKVNKSGITFDNIKGLDNIKEFTLATVRNPMSLGILLLGPAGTCKSTFCKALGNEAGIPAYEMEIGQMFGSLVGESEQKMSAAIDFFTANAPCIAVLDEIEKGLSGAGGSGSTDSGTTVRTTSLLLKFLSDGRPPGVKVYGTCNDISKLPPEWVRAERWDCAPFFIDLPSTEERLDILEYYRGVYKVEGEPVSMEGWSGAEIKAVCRIAAMMGKRLEQAERYVIPISKTMGDKISALRMWAKEKTIPASTPMPRNGEKITEYIRRVEF